MPQQTQQTPAKPQGSFLLQTLLDLGARYGVELPHSDGSILTRIEETELDNGGLLTEARALMSWIQELTATSTPPPPPHILILDQSLESVSMDDMHALIAAAQTENINPLILIYPAKCGAAQELAATTSAQIAEATHTLHDLLSTATAVYTHSAQAGFDALLSGHKPRVFGQPFYSGWGLTADETPPLSHRKTLTRAQLVAATLLDTQDAVAEIEAKCRAQTQDEGGYIASNIHPWKRRFLRRYLGDVTFSNDPQAIQAARDTGRRHLHWGVHESADFRVEDGFLRSRGLGAALVPPLSLVLDDLGLYLDPNAPSHLEEMIAARTPSPHVDARARALISQLKALQLTKYNVGTQAGLPTERPYILVAGQVEDDASIQKGCPDIRTNLDLLKAARTAHPDDFIIYKPHPDVEAGLRSGRVDAAGEYADHIARNADPLSLLTPQAQALWTMTSLLGFEALIRGIPVTCAGLPFYAGWGLTQDLCPPPERRSARPTLESLTYAALVDYPRYFDLQTGAAISVEMALRQLATAPSGRRKLTQFLIAKARRLRAMALGR